MKDYLFSVVDHAADTLICHSYFLSDKNCQASWDGRSQIQVNLPVAITSAQEYAKDHCPQAGRIVEVSLSSVERVGGDYYYLSVRFEVDQGEADDFVVVLDLDGQLIPVVEKTFDDDDALDEYLNSLPATD